ncbi:hypothetical protein, partial [Kocuria coralli]|uniref:hypothetical protein n=1 Tax=Kocuria coralli TaxID=1461025 RepID=UPI001C705D90
MSKEHRPRRQGRGRWAALVPGILIVLAAGFAALFWGPSLLTGAWVPEGSSPEEVDLHLRLAQVITLSIGGAIAIVGVGLSLSRHHEELEANKRDQRRLDAERDRELRERYVTAVELLSDSERPIKRTAALYALGALADDWHSAGRHDEVQVCINTITGYLRQPLDGLLQHPQDETPARSAEEGHTPSPDVPKQELHNEVSVRTTGYKIIANHLRENANPSWSENQLDLSGVQIFHPVDLTNIKVTGKGSVDLGGATITEGGSV